jgi:hypothetical protein
MKAVRITRVIVVALTLTSCSEQEAPNFTLLEVIDVQGTCFEDHVQKQDQYSGQIVRWQSKETGKIMTYGTVTKPLKAEAIIEEAKHPTAYYTPYSLSFDQIGIDTSQPKWVLHGVSDRGEAESSYGYDSTCELAVMKRGMEIHKPR